MNRCTITPCERTAATTRLLMLLSLTLVPLLAASSARAAVLYVNAAATGEVQDGKSWATAFRTIQAAVDAAVDGDELWVAAGLYPSTRLTHSVQLYGGFAGTETAREERDLTHHRTVIDGGASTALTAKLLSPAVRVDGFTIRSTGRGYDTFLGRSTLANNVFDRCGVGINADPRDDSTSLTISSNTFLMNQTGVIAGNFVTLSDNTFLGNRTAARIAKPKEYYVSAGHPVLLRNRFIGNESAVTIRNLYTELISNVFSRNEVCLTFNWFIWAINNTFTWNSTAIRPSGGSYYSFQPFGFVQNNIFAHNGIGISGMIDGPTQVNSIPVPNIVHNCFFANQTDTVGNLRMEGNINADPMIVGDEGRVHIQSDSPCRDAGRIGIAEGTYYGYSVQDAWFDTDGQRRIQGPNVDIGADESDGTLWPETTESRITYVRQDGDDFADGTTWASAKRTIQAGVIEATIQDGEVWVTGGLYRENVHLLPTVSLYGGFAGTEAERDGRDPSQNISRIVPADRNRPVVDTLYSPYPVTLDGFTFADGSIGVRVAAPGFAVRRCRFLTNETGIEAHVSTVADACDFRGNAVGVLCVGPRAATVPDQTRLTNSVFAGNGLGMRAANKAQPALIGNTFLMNMVGVSVNDTGSATITNCLFVKNDVGVERIGTAATVTARHNNAWGNGTGWANLPDPTGQDGNIALDPKIVSDALGDIHLLPGSPCIDAGDGTAVNDGATDVDGQARIQGAGVDIGADEADGTVRTATPRTVRISPTGNDASDGAAWADAKRSLGAALDAAGATGGEVWVADGTYLENARLMPFVSVLGGFKGSEASASERAAARDGTVLEPSDAEAATLTAMTGMAPVTLDGLTIRNGGVGLFCDASAPTVTNNFLHDNRTGIHAFFRSRPVIAGNILEANGDGVVLDDAARATVRNNIIRGSEVGVYAYDANPAIVGNLIVEGGTGLEATWKATPHAVNNTIARNEAGVVLKNWGKPLIANNIIALNTTGVRSTGIGNAPTLRHSLVGANGTGYADLADPTGTDGNLTADPLFLDAAAGNYRLWSASPAIDAGENSWLTLIGADLDGAARPAGAHVDLGAYEYRSVVADYRVRAVAALRAAGGLVLSTAGERAMLDQDADGFITTRDAIRWLREHLK